jgi:hypothetical protein
MLKNILSQLAGYTSATDRQTPVQKTAQSDHSWFLRFAITPFVLIQSLCSELAESLDECEELEALKAFIGLLPQNELYLSCPVNVITGGLALPNTGRGMVLMGGPTIEEGGTVVMYSAQLATVGVEKFLSLPQAHAAAVELSEVMSKDLGAPITVNLEAKIAERQITTAQNEQRRDAKRSRQDRKGGYQPTQRAAKGSTEQPAFAGPSGTQGNSEDPDIPNL